MSQHILEGQILSGRLFNEPMRVETVASNGSESWILGLVGTQSEKFRRVTLTAADLKSLTIQSAKKTFDGDGHLLPLGLHAYALGIAYEFDPYFGLSISRVDPLPHQLEAVYDYLLKGRLGGYEARRLAGKTMRSLRSSHVSASVTGL